MSRVKSFKTRLYRDIRQIRSTYCKTLVELTAPRVPSGYVSVLHTVGKDLASYEIIHIYDDAPATFWSVPCRTWKRANEVGKQYLIRTAAAQTVASKQRG